MRHRQESPMNMHGSDYSTKKGRLMRHMTPGKTDSRTETTKDRSDPHPAPAEKNGRGELQRSILHEYFSKRDP